MQPIDRKIFFFSYLTDHYYHKQVTLKKILDNYASLKNELLSDVENLSDDTYCASIRAEIRSTLFQAIETLFELIFCLDGNNGIINNENLWYNLSTSDWRNNYSKISKIGEGDINFMDQIVIVNSGKGIEVPLVQYIFYYAVTDQISIETIHESTSAIKKILISFAKEFTDRDEYNALKHSIRLFPFLKTWEIFEHETKETIAKFDLTNSMTYLKEEKDGTLVHYTKPFDTERDYKMTYLCSKLISNIIRSRRMAMLNENVVLCTFTDEALASSEKRNVEIQNITITLKQID